MSVVGVVVPSLQRDADIKVNKWMELKKRTSSAPTVSGIRPPFDVNGNHRGKLSHGHKRTVDMFLLPLDPRSWTPQDVRTWLHHMTKTHSLDVDTSFFQMNGRGLCLMPLKGFMFRVPDHGKLLYEDFRDRLRRCLLAPGNKAKRHTIEANLKTRPVIVSRQQGGAAVGGSSSVLGLKARKSPLTYHTL